MQINHYRFKACLSVCLSGTAQIYRQSQRDMRSDRSSDTGSSHGGEEGGSSLLSIILEYFSHDIVSRRKSNDITGNILISIIWKRSKISWLKSSSFAKLSFCSAEGNSYYKCITIYLMWSWFCLSCKTKHSQMRTNECNMCSFFW